MMCDKCPGLAKAVKSGIVLYALIFTFASALMFYVPQAMLEYASLVLVAALVFIVSKHYFMDHKAGSPVCGGLCLGAVFAAVMFVLDVLIMVYGFASDMGWSYFMSRSQYLGYGLTIVIPVLAAKMATGKKAAPRKRRR